MFQSDEALYSAIYSWIEKTPLSDFHEAIRKRVIGQPILKDICSAVYSYLWCLLHDTIPNHNFILAAPSGSGKTETYRALRDYFLRAIPQLPVYSVDISQITATGFRGSEPVSILEPLARRGDAFPAAIIFLDEFDKVLMPAYGSHGDVHANLQANLLTLIEGGTFTLEHRPMQINTSNILFIAAGAFEDFRKNRSASQVPCGFKSDSNLPSVVPASYSPLSKEDLLKVGGITELVGRFSYIYNYDALPDDAYTDIVNKIIAVLSDTFQCNITIDQGLVSDIVANEKNSPFGIRALESYFQEMVLHAWSEIQYSGVKLLDCDLVLHLYPEGYDYEIVEFPEEDAESIPEDDPPRPSASKKKEPNSS